LNDKISVLLTTEGTYPYHQGGVSTWCETLVNNLDAVDYVIYSVIMNPFVTQKFQLPKNTELVTVPLWGTEEPCEHLTVPFSQIYLKKKHTGQRQLTEHFVPLISNLIHEIISENKNPIAFGETLLELYNYFQEWEYKVSFKSETTWNLYKEIVLKAASDKQNKLSQPDLHGLIQSLGWVYRFLTILNTPIPETNVTHSSAAAFCGIPCVLSKLKYNTPFLLTEHGVYLREQYLSLAKRGYSSFLNTFLIRFVQSITSLNYAFADQISPVCQYNTRWEKRFGVPADKIKVIYNGVDDSVFTESAKRANEHPTVVMVARVDPIKDILTFIKAAHIVKQEIPNVKFIVYGSVSVQEYYEECLALKERLELEDTFIFAGHTSHMSAAYQSGDVIALTSISEAFPYSVVEAMMTGKPVVATDVGGIKEALADTGLLVSPRDPEQFAREAIRLLKNPELRYVMGQEARQRALSFFTLDKVLDLHLKSYIQLASKAVERVPADERQEELANQKLLMEKGFALVANGFYREAISQFRAAINEKPNSPYTPVLLAEISKVYNRLGEYDMALQELDKCTAFVHMVQLEALDIA